MSRMFEGHLVRMRNCSPETRPIYIVVLKFLLGSKAEGIKTKEITSRLNVVELISSVLFT